MNLTGHFDISGKNAQANVAFAATVLQSIHDREAGPIGRQMIDSLYYSGCTITNKGRNDEDTLNLQQQEDGAGAYFNSFRLNDPDRRFVNEIEVSKTRNPYLLTTAISHEITHSNAWQNAPVLHASPYNTNNPAKPDIVLCPRDWMRLVMATEQDAFAVQTWVRELATQHDPRFGAQENSPLYTPKTFTEARQQTGSLREAKVYVGNEAMNAWLDGPKYTNGHHYAGLALTNYETCPRLANPAGIVVVRMEPEDYHLAGETIGPNIFADPRLYANNKLDDFLNSAGKQQLERINTHLGVTDENKLPTFREALARYGLTPETYLEISKQPLNMAPRAPYAQNTNSL